ncbi:hypothetical protein ACS0TY_021746 [Phlomoides rotata]
MGSPEGLGRGSVVGEVRWGTEGACSSGGRKDDIHALNVSAPPFWHNRPVSEHCMEVSQPSSVSDRNLGDMNSRPPALDNDVKLLVHKSSKIERRNGRCTKTSGVAQIENSKCKPRLHAANGISPEVVASSSASRNTSEKNQLIKQKNNSAGRRGEKRNSKVKHKNRCDSFSLKNGLVGFSSAAGGNNFFGAYGLKPDVFDITKYVNERPLHELLRGSDTCIAKDKGKKATSSNNDLLQSVRSVCSVLQAKKVLHAQNYAEVDNSCIRRLSSGFITVNSVVGQTDGEKGHSYSADLPSSNQVLESAEKTKMSTVAESPLLTPTEILERLALPPPKDLDLLLSDASKATPSLKSNTDPRLGKQVLHRAGLPPFSWSHSFSGHSKLGSDTPKSSTSRTVCQGRWVKVKTSSPLQNGLANLLVDFESLAFDQNLVPLTNHTCEQAKKFAPIERDLSTLVACSSSEVPADECSSTHAAAQTLLQMAAFSKENPCVKVSKKPSQITMTAGKSKAIKRSNFFDPPNSSIRPPSSSRVGDYSFSSKKIRLSSDVISHTDTMRKGKSQQSPLLCFKSPPRKLSRDSNANTEENGTNLVKKQYVMKTPRSIDRPGGTKRKLWKPSQ